MRNGPVCREVYLLRKLVKEGMQMCVVLHIIAQWNGRKDSKGKKGET